MELDLISKYRDNAYYKLLLLDYDGTLVDYATRPEQALPTERVFNLLLKLSQNPSLKVVVITGRGYFDIENMLGDLPIDIVADHGATIREKGRWKKYIRDNGLWKNEIFPLMKHFTNECPNAFIEEKRFALTWHYRNVESLSGFTLSRDLIRMIRDKANSLGLKIFDGNKIVEVVPEQIGKGIAIQYLLKQDCYDFIMAIGDDKTDEEMFEILLNNKNAITVKVGEGITCAKHKFANVNAVLIFLELLSV